jgi:hypothetical protein
VIKPNHVVTSIKFNYRDNCNAISEDRWFYAEVTRSLIYVFITTMYGLGFNAKGFDTDLWMFRISFLDKVVSVLVDLSGA